MVRALRRHVPISISVLIPTLVALVLIVPGQAQQAGQKAPAARESKSYERPTDPSLYVGEETCKTCHEDMPSKDFVKNYEGSPPLCHHHGQEKRARVARLRSLPRPRKGPR